MNDSIKGWTGSSQTYALAWGVSWLIIVVSSLLKPTL